MTVEKAFCFAGVATDARYIYIYMHARSYGDLDAARFCWQFRA